jgi:two-component system chemotaxis response regulator CheB
VLPNILSRAGKLPAQHACDEEPIIPGRIYVAPPGCHLILEPGQVRLTNGPKENGHRPAVDPLFRSAAFTYGHRVVGIILSGNLDDGSAGLLSVKQHGELAIVQDPDTALYADMPRNAIGTVTVDHVTPVAALPTLIVQLVQRPAAEGTPMTDDAPSHSATMHDGEEVVRLEDRQQQAGVPSTMTCPECHGTLWEVHNGDLLHFRCRVGHAFSPDALLAHQAEALEAAMWTALRALEEHAAMNRRLAARAQGREHAHSAAVFTEHAVLPGGVTRPAARGRDAVTDSILT